nr:ABC transporter substrate-binding protein/permease [Lachnospiraceae bacterium]
AVSSGKVDIGLSGFTITEERKEQINFSDSYTTSRQVIVVRNGKSSSGFSSIKERFYTNFVAEARWKYLAQGLLNTIIITVASLVIGSILGFFIAMIRVAHDKNGTCKAANLLCNIYVTVIRGTPMMVQLLIIYFVIFASVDISKIIVAIIAFGLNSAAYLSEVIRSGIMAIDPGQFEAGRSLGLGFGTMMTSVILPQALKNVLPAIGNEFISLLKETSISGYIGLQDLTRGGDIIRGITYEPLLPLLTVAIVYLILVMLLSAGVRKLEAAMKKNER